MLVKKRKDFRGFNGHVRKLLFDLIKTEFKELGKPWVEFHDGLHPWQTHRVDLSTTWYREEGLASVAPFGKIQGEQLYRIHINGNNKDWLEMDDEEIKDVLRHELYHITMDKRDIDISFIKKCWDEGLSLNLISRIVWFAYQYETASLYEKRHFNKALFECCFGW